MLLEFRHAGMRHAIAAFDFDADHFSSAFQDKIHFMFSVTPIVVIEAFGIGCIEEVRPYSRFYHSAS